MQTGSKLNKGSVNLEKVDDDDGLSIGNALFARLNHRRKYIDDTPEEEDGSDWGA